MAKSNKAQRKSTRQAANMNAASIGETLLNSLAPVLAALGASYLEKALQSLHASKPEVAKTVLTSLYPPIDVHLEPLVGKTRTRIDDAFMDAFLGAIEAVAEEHGIDLPNLDND